MARVGIAAIPQFPRWLRRLQPVLRGQPDRRPFADRPRSTSNYSPYGPRREHGMRMVRGQLSCVTCQLRVVSGQLSGERESSLNTDRRTVLPGERPTWHWIRMTDHGSRIIRRRTPQSPGMRYDRRRKAASSCRSRSSSASFCCSAVSASRRHSRCDSCGVGSHRWPAGS